MNNARITPYQPPQLSAALSRGVPSPRDLQPNLTPAPKVADSKTAAKLAKTEINPLAALFTQGVKNPAPSRKINLSVEDQPVRGRFVDVMA